MPTHSHREHYRKRDGFGSRGNKRLVKAVCRVCNEPVDAFHDASKCEAEWMRRIEAEDKQKGRKP